MHMYTVAIAAITLGIPKPIDTPNAILSDTLRPPPPSSSFPSADPPVGFAVFTVVVEVEVTLIRSRIIAGAPNQYIAKNRAAPKSVMARKCDSLDEKVVVLVVPDSVTVAI
jgi:hypothetical protein